MGRAGLSDPLLFALAALALLGVLVVAFVSEYEARQLSANRALSGAGEVVARIVGRVVEVATALEPCGCERASSPLWDGGLLRLSVLVEHGTSAEDAARGTEATNMPPSAEAPIYRCEVAVVNNGSEPVMSVKLRLVLQRKLSNGETRPMSDRGLFYEGPLGAGRAVKWHVEGRGDALSVASVSAVPDASSTVASIAAGDAFFALRNARLAVVRQHAAMMLAYLGDARAAELLHKEKGLVMDRVARLTTPLVGCDLRLEGDVFGACVFNTSSRPQRALRIEAFDRSGDVVGRWPLEFTLPVHEGLRVSEPFARHVAVEEIAVFDSNTRRASEAEER